MEIARTFFQRGLCRICRGLGLSVAAFLAFAFVSPPLVLSKEGLAQHVNSGRQKEEMSPDFSKYDFTLKSLDGISKVRLKDVVEDNYVVLVFWAAGCPLCDFAMPYVKLYDDFLGENEIDDIKVITVALDARAEDPLSVAVEEKYGFEILHDPMGRDTGEAFLLDKKGIPACYVFNKEGYIIATLYGFNKKLVNEIQESVNADRQSHGGAKSRPNKIVE